MPGMGGTNPCYLTMVLWWGEGRQVLVHALLVCSIYAMCCQGQRPYSSVQSFGHLILGPASSTGSLHLQGLETQSSV